MAAWQARGVGGYRADGEWRIGGRGKFRPSMLIYCLTSDLQSSEIVAMEQSIEAVRNKVSRVICIHNPIPPFQGRNGRSEGKGRSLR